MSLSKHHNPPHKHTQLTKKKKILLSILIPVVSLGVCGAGVDAGYAIWHNKTPEKPQPTPFPSSLIKIDSNIEAKYLTKPSDNIYVDQGSPITFGHQLLDLKALSDANNGICNFIIQGPIHFGFLVNPDMNCFLFGDTNSLVSISAATNTACGVIVGERTNPTANFAYKGIMHIDSSINFKITSTSANAYGVYIYNAASGSTQTINGTFMITASLFADGVYFKTTTSGSTTINGTFAISSITRDAYGVCFGDTTSGSTTVNGTFTISSTRDAYGVVFASAAAGSTQTINGTFTVSSTRSARGVIFNSAAAAGSTTINGTFTIVGGNSGLGIGFSSTANGSKQTINGTFTITGVNGAFGVYFENSASGLLIMSTAQFFSNKVDFGNIFQKCSIASTWWIGQYKWNNADVEATGTSGNLPTGNNSQADQTLSLTTVYDAADENSSHFNIKVIDDAMNSNKTIFNTAYKNALQKYLDGSDCPTTAKQWLNDIIRNIPIPST